MDFPIPFIVRTIKTPCILRFINSSHIEKKPHWHVVIPSDGHFFVITHITSQKDTRIGYHSRGRFAQEAINSLVEVTPTDFPFLRIPSIVECNSTELYTIDGFIRLIDPSFAPAMETISDEVLGRILSGIKSSPAVDEDIKERLDSFSV